MPFPRAVEERRLSDIDGGGPKKEKRKINGASTPSRRVEKGERDRDEGCPHSN